MLSHKTHKTLLKRAQVADDTRKSKYGIVAADAKVQVQCVTSDGVQLSVWCPVCHYVQLAVWYPVCHFPCGAVWYQVAPCGAVFITVCNFSCGAVCVTFRVAPFSSVWYSLQLFVWCRVCHCVQPHPWKDKHQTANIRRPTTVQ